MALTDENNMVMPVTPLYGNNGGFGNNFGGDGWWIILLLLAFNGGWGGFGGFGMGGYGAMMGMGMMGMDYLYPWLNNSQNINDGFRDQQLSTQINGIQNAVTSGFGDVQTALCGGFAGVNQNVSQGFANTNLGMCQGFNGVNTAINNAQNSLTQQMYSNQLADLERSFAAQTATTSGMNDIAMNLQNCCCENRAGIADLKYTVATENCADRTQAMQNTRDIIDAVGRGNQAILDKLCALELDGVKAQLAQAQRENTGLQNAVNMAAFRESQANQNALFAQGMTNEVDALYNRLKNCPVNTVPVFGNQPIFTCAQNVANSNCGCGCGSF